MSLPKAGFFISHALTFLWLEEQLNIIIRLNVPLETFIKHALFLFVQKLHAKAYFLRI